MSAVFIIHGASGHPHENWFPWLKGELEKKGHEVFIPRFPTPEDQTLENWWQVFSGYENFLHDDSVLIGHSLGVPFILRILEKHKAEKAIFVAAFAELFPENAEFQTISFVGPPFDWPKIRKNCREFFIFHSDNDPYVPLEKAENLAANLQTKLNIVPGAGHFNEAAGYLKFEKLLKLF